MEWEYIMLRLIILFFLFFCLTKLVQADISTYTASSSKVADADLIMDLVNLSLLDLMDVEIITAGKTAEKIGDIPASVVLITRRDIEVYGYRTLDEIFEHILGLYGFEYYNSGGKSFAVRGFGSGSTNRNITIMLNGVPQIEHLYATQTLSYIPISVHSIDRIEVVRGPLSVMYGSGAFFGAINIITNDIEQTKQAVTIGAGSLQTTHASIRSQKAWHDGYIVFDAAFDDTEGFDIPYTALMNTPFDYLQGTSTKGILGSQRKALNVSGQHQSLFYNISYMREKKAGIFPVPPIPDGNTWDSRKLTAQLGYETALSNNVDFKAKLTYFNYSSFTHYNLPIYGTEYSRYHAYDAELNLFWRPNQQINVTFGANYQNVPKANSGFNIPPLNHPTTRDVLLKLGQGSHATTRALFTQLNYQPTEQWKMVIGLRLEQILPYDVYHSQAINTPDFFEYRDTYNEDSISIVPRLAMVYSPNERNIFKLMYGKAINAPSIQQNISHSVNSMGRPQLEAEQVTTYELNYLHYFSNDYLLNTSIFRNELNNLITSVNELEEDGSYTFYESNLGEWDANGFELSLQAHPIENWTVELGMSYQKTEDKSSDIDIAYSPHWLGQMKTAYQWRPNISTSLIGHYISSMKSEYLPTQENPDGTYGGRIGVNSSDQFILSANMRFDNILVKNSFINLHIYNLLDKEIRYPTIVDWNDKGTLSYERFFMLTLGFEFD
jgi:outer membrane receptor protein involved in Fe transport